MNRLAQRKLIAQIDAARRQVYASLPESYRFVQAVRQIFKTAYGDSYSKSDIERLFNSVLKAHNVDTRLGWNWGEEIWTSTVKNFRDMQRKSRSLDKADFEDLISHVVSSLGTGMNSISGGKYEHGDVGKICSDYLAAGYSVLDIVKLVKNKVFQLSQDWIRKQSRHQIVTERGKSLNDTTKSDEGSGTPFSEKIVDMGALNRIEQQELRTDLKRVVEKIHNDLTRKDPALGMIWEVYMQNPDIDASTKIAKEQVTVMLEGRPQRLPLVDALNALYIDGTDLKPYTERSVYYLVTKIRVYLKEKYADIIDAALS